MIRKKLLITRTFQLFKIFKYLIFFLIYMYASHSLLQKKNGNFAVSEISTISLISRNISGYGGRVPPLRFVRMPLSRAIIHLSPDIQMQLSYRLPQHDAIMANPVVSSACSFSRFRISRDGSNARLNPLFPTSYRCELSFLSLKEKRNSNSPVCRR